ncbi:MAG: energy-coupling factor transporter transmembrane component T [Bacillota bacterium]
MSAPFEFEYRDTFVHRLNPLSKLLLFGFFLIIGGLYLDPKIKLPLLACLLVILRKAKLSLKPYKLIIVLAVVATVIGESYTAVFMVNPAYFKVYSPDWVSVEVLRLTPPDFPIFGATGITYGVLLYLLASCLTVVSVILAVAGLVHTTSLSDIVSVLVAIRMPFPVVFVSTVGLRFIPELTRQINVIRTAQSLRGWNAETRNPLKRVAMLRPLFVPIVRHVIKSIDVMTMSSKNRGFGLTRVTPVRSFDFTAVDYAVSAGSAALLIAGLYGLFACNLGML